MFDGKEFERIVNKYKTELFRYCYYRMKNDKQLAEETLDDIFMVLFKKWASLVFKDDRNTRAYLYRVADKCIRHNQNNHTNSHSVSFEKMLQYDDLDQLVVYDTYFQSDMSIEEQLEIIASHMPKETQVVFRLRYIEKKKLMDIAEQTGLPYSTIRSRLQKAEKTVEKEIKKLFCD